MGPHFATRHFNFELRCRRIHRHAQNRGRHQTASTVDVAAVSAMPPDPTLGRLRSEYRPLHKRMVPGRSKMKHQPICTRCRNRVSDTDAEARFKNGEIIACSICAKAPTPRHRYHRKCQCQYCLRVRAVLMEK